LPVEEQHNVVTPWSRAVPRAIVAMRPCRSGRIVALELQMKVELEQFGEPVCAVERRPARAVVDRAPAGSSPP